MREPKEVKTERALRRTMKTDANMKPEEIIQRLNRMCVTLLRKSALELNRAGYDDWSPSEAETLAEEYRKDATAINLAAMTVYLHMK